MNSHRDPEAFVNEAKAALRNGKEDDLVGWPVYTIGAELELVLGRWKMLNGESPESEFRRSQDLLMKVVEVGPKPTVFEVWCSRARLFRWWAEWKFQSNRSAEKEIRLGLEGVSKALELNPRAAEMIGTKGIFLLIQSSSTPLESQRKELLQKASACFEEAIKINPNVSHMFSPLLKLTANYPDNRQGLNAIPFPDPQELRRRSVVLFVKHPAENISLRLVRFLYPLLIC